MSATRKKPKLGWVGDSDPGKMIADEKVESTEPVQHKKGLSRSTKFLGLRLGYEDAVFPESFCPTQLSVAQNRAP